MIIGNGLVAKKFQHNYKNRNVIIFASGVSNSLETDDTQFYREKQLLKDTLKKYPNKLLLYFSSRGLENKQLLPYYQHKLNMENLIKSSQNKYIICRIHHIVGRGGGDSTIVNFLYNKILTQKSFDLWQNSCRYLIDIEDVYKIVDYIINNNLFTNQTINFPAAKIKVFDLVNKLENILKKSSIINIMNKGVCLSIDSELDEILEKLGIYFHKDYIKNLLVKYYGIK